MGYLFGLPKYFFGVWLIAILVGLAAAGSTTSQELDYGFNETASIGDFYAIELHSNANFTAMAPYFAYAFSVDGEGNVVRYLPRGSNIRPDDFSEFKVSYHAGKGVPLGSGVEENMNLRTIGIGLLYGLNESPSETQLIATARLVTQLKAAHPEIKMVATQTAFSGYRMAGVAVCNQSRCWLNLDGLIANAWNFPMERFVTLLNDAGGVSGISWQYLEWVNWKGHDSWKAEYAIAETVGSLMV